MLYNILLVEDDAMIASGISYALSTEGYEVVHTDNVADAKRKLNEKTFDMAILDVVCINYYWFLWC